MGFRSMSDLYLVYRTLIGQAKPRSDSWDCSPLSGNSTRPTAPLKPSPTRVGAHSCTRNRLKTHSSSRPSLRTEKMAAMTVSMTGVRASATPTTRRARIGSRQVAPSAFRRSAVATGRRSNSLVVGPTPLT